MFQDCPEDAWAKIFEYRGRKKFKAFREGVQRYLSGGRGAEPFLPAVDVAFASYGRVTILGRLEGT